MAAGDAKPGELRAGGSASGEGREQLFDLYKVHVEEYRFQVQLNWQRTRYLLALNTAILGIGAGLLRIEGGSPLVVAAVFLVGLAVAGSSLIAMRQQRGYYRAARQGKAVLEDALDLPPEQRIATTPTMRGETRFRFRVNGALRFTVILIGLLDLAGVVYSVYLLDL